MNVEQAKATIRKFVLACGGPAPGGALTLAKIIADDHDCLSARVAELARQSLELREFLEDATTLSDWDMAQRAGKLLNPAESDSAYHDRLTARVAELEAELAKLERYLKPNADAAMAWAKLEAENRELRERLAATEQERSE